MNSYGNPARMRGAIGQNPAMAKPNKFTFQKNLKKPRMQQPRFAAPQPMNVANYGMVSALKTPMLSNNSMSCGFEVSSDPYEKEYPPAMETDMYAGDQEFWDEPYIGNYDAYSEPENIPMQNEDNRYQRKKSCPFPPNENFAPKIPRSSYRMMDHVNPNQISTVHESPKPSLKQTVLCTDTPSGLGFKIKPNENVGIVKSNLKVCPKWSPDLPVRFKSKIDMDNTFPRVFSVTVEKLQTWPKVLNCGQMILELFGILDKAWDVKNPKSKKIQLKSQKVISRVTCTFYEIDRPAPNLKTGQWLRCIVLLRSNQEYQCLSVRPASTNELKYMDKLVIDSSKFMAMVLKSLN